jgi:dolichol-phosphate hexosyltransferase
LSVLIGYKARGREEGKKLTWRDGVEALWIPTRLRLRSGDRSGGRRQIDADPAQIMPPGRR